MEPSETGIDEVARPEVLRETTPTVVFAGPPGRNNRQDDAIEAFRHLRRHVSNAQMWIIGSGLIEELQDNVCEGVEFLGGLEEEEKRNRLARAHCLVVTSIGETWRSLITDAAQVGTPAIAYDVHGLRNSVTGSGGILVAPRVDALGQALIDHLPRWAAAGVPLVEPGSVKPWTMVAMDILEQAISRAVSSRRAVEQGEDVAAAWRRAVSPIAAWCDRRAWSVAGIAALVAIAPLSEMGQERSVELAAGLSLACFAIAVLGTWVDAVRQPLLAPTNHDNGLINSVQTLAHHSIDNSVSEEIRRHVTDKDSSAPRRWPRVTPVVMVGVIAGLIVQGFLSIPNTLPGLGSLLGSTWMQQFRLTVPAGQQNAARMLLSIIQFPLTASGRLLQVFATSGGLNERFWITLMIAGIAMSMAGLLLVLGFDPWATGIGGMLYALNPYVFAMSGMAISYLAAMIAVPGLVAWVLWISRLEQYSRLQILWATGALLLSAITLGLVAESPPLLLACGAALLGAVLLTGWIEGRRAMSRALRRTTLFLGGLIAAGAYWMVPFAKLITSSSVLRLAANRQWQWATSRATLSNTFWLNTSWDWTNRTVFPYAARFEHFPLIFWKYALPVAAFACFGIMTFRQRYQIDQQRIRLLVAAGLVALLTLTLATGVRTPGGPIFALLTALPFGWILEDPGRFLFLASSAYAILIAMEVDQWNRKHFINASKYYTNPLRFSKIQSARLASVLLLSIVLTIPAFPLVMSLPQHPEPSPSERQVPIFSGDYLRLPDNRQLTGRLSSKWLAAKGIYRKVPP